MIASLLASAVVGSPIALKQDMPQRDPNAPAGPRRMRDGGPPQDGKPPEKSADPYGDATKGFTKQDGMLTVWRKDETVLFEVPTAMIGRDMGWIVEFKGTPAGSYSGSLAAGAMIRFEQRGEKLLVRAMDYSTKATEGDEIKLGIEQSNIMPIIAALDIKGRNKNGSPVVDASRFFKGELPEVSTAGALGGPMDPSRSFIDTVNVFPNNINVEVEATYGGAPGGAGRGRGGFGGAPSRPSNTAIVHHSIFLLPEQPMRPRIKDSRVGYFSTGFSDYGTNYHGVKEYEYIDRYRLEKKDPTAELSEPKKQIVYYISREVPKKWWPYLKAGVEEWNGAFEQAGFKNAIVCKPAPTKEEDPKWSPEDARYSVIRWAPLPIENAVGPHYSDPRTGEILSAHVIVWHDIMKLQKDWYFAQASAVDPRAQHLPLPDDLMGDCLQFVVAHEVGHTLGLPHNGKASSTVPIALLRDAKWTKENGTCPSIMDYARFNYVAQPGDGASMIPKVGMYDKYSIMWGYKPILGAATPGDEKQTLDEWAGMQANNPMLRFYDNFNAADPTAQSESLSDDCVEASRLGTLNLQRSMGFVEQASTKYGEDYSELSDAYSALFSQFSLFTGHVATVVGGEIQTDYHVGRGGDVYAPAPALYQSRAVDWLVENTLDTPYWLVPRSIVNKIGPGGTVARISALQTRVLNRLMDSGRIARMIDAEQTNPGAFTVGQMMSKVRSNVWRETLDSSPKVDAYRRSMQRDFVNVLVGKLSDPRSEARAVASAELRLASSTLRSASAKTTDYETKAHFDDLRNVIELSLNFPPAPAPAATGFIFGAQDGDQPDAADSCRIGSGSIGD